MNYYYNICLLFLLLSLLLHRGPGRDEQARGGRPVPPGPQDRRGHPGERESDRRRASR